MFLKMGILATILVLAGIMFSSEIQGIFPNTSNTVVDSLEADVNTITEKSVDSAEKKIESSVDKAETKLYEIKQNSTEYVEEKISETFLFLNPDD